MQGIQALGNVVIRDAGMNIVSLFDQAVQKHTNKTAIIDVYRRKDRQVTYRQLDQCANTFAWRLQCAGLRPGAKVLVLQPVSMELYALLLALFRLEMTAVFIDPGSDRRRLKETCCTLAVDAIAGSAKNIFLAGLDPYLRTIASRVVLPSYAPELHESVFAKKNCQELLSSLSSSSCGVGKTRSENQFVSSGAKAGSKSVIALLTLSSGSTGVPKIIVRSHDLLFKQYQAIASCLNLQHDQVYLTALPVFVLANLAAGSTVILPALKSTGLTSMNCKRIVAQITSFRPSYLLASPYFVEELANFCVGKKIELSCLRSIYTGGAPVFFDNLQRLKLLNQQADIHIVYGSSEAEPIAHLSVNSISTADMQRMRFGKGLLVGKPVKDIAVKVLVSDGNSAGWPGDTASLAASMATWQCGQIAVSGDHVVKDVFGSSLPVEDKVVMEGKVWHLTGDSGFFDEKGQLWLLGRSAQISPLAPHLSPFSIESLARDCWGVKNAALMQISEYEQPVLIIQPSRDQKPDLGQIFEMTGLEKILLVRKIPLDKRHNGKIDYRALKQLIGQMKAAEDVPVLTAPHIFAKFKTDRS